MDKKYQFSGSGLNAEQKQWGADRFNEYLTSFPHLNTSGNVHLLEDLVWVETMQEWAKLKMAKYMNVEAKPGSAYTSKNSGVPTDLTTEITRYRDEITTLKEKLNMLDAPETKDTYQQLDEIFKKCADHREQHIDDYLARCPWCAKHFVMMVETKDYVAIKTPFYEDCIIFNRPMMEDYHAGILTKEQVAKYLGVNERFIDWLDAKFYGIKVTIDGGTNLNPPANEESAPTSQ